MVYFSMGPLKGVTPQKLRGPKQALEEASWNNCKVLCPTPGRARTSGRQAKEAMNPTALPQSCAQGPKTSPEQSSLSRFRRLDHRTCQKQIVAVSVLLQGSIVGVAVKGEGDSCRMVTKTCVAPNMGVYDIRGTILGS